MTNITFKTVIDAIRLSASSRAYDFFFVDDFERIYERLVREGVNTPKRWAALLGTLHHESGGYRSFEENLNYREQTLMRVWPSRFKTRATARKYAHNPQALANYVYNGRMGNAMGSNDGWNYRGRGLIQLTGKSNYLRYMILCALDFQDNPDQVATNSMAMWLVAAKFFNNTKVKGESLLELADQDRIKEICKAVNGGYHGLADRVTWTKFYEAVFDELDNIPKRTLMKRGDKGPMVKQLQFMFSYIASNGKDKIKHHDGIFGKNTEKAVINFQTRNGLVPDGIVGTRTYFALFQVYDEMMDLEDF